MEGCFGNLTYADENQKEPQPIVISKRKFVIGRAKDCDLALNNRMVSGHHCYLETVESGQVYLHDTSSNGTLLNQIRLTHGQKHLLNSGDEFRVVFKKGLQAMGLIFSAPALCSKKDEQEGDDTSSLNDTEEYAFELPANTAGSSAVIIPCDDDTTKIDIATVQVEKPAKAEASITGDDEIEDHLICSICQEILYKPVSLQPCMHCFCSGCYSEWMTLSQECPQCRLDVERIGPNHIVSNLVNAYLKLHPEKQRDEEDIRELEAKNKITHDMLYSRKLLQTRSSDVDTSYDSLSSEEPEEDDTTVFLGRQKRTFVPYHKLCRQCPEQPDAPHTKQQKMESKDDVPRVGVAGCSQPSTSAGLTKANFICKNTTLHIHCSCCFEYMPDRSLDRQHDASIPPQNCVLCPIPASHYCNMYWGCKAAACTGCLAPLRSIIFAENCLDHIINGNVYESNVFKAYLESRKIGWKEVFTQCIAKLDSGVYTINGKDLQKPYQQLRPVVITSQTPVCKYCAYKCFTYLAYRYRADISRQDLDDEVTGRDDCYWGKNCRSQTKYHHAKNFNHICEQTRFK